MAYRFHGAPSGRSAFRPAWKLAAGLALIASALTAHAVERHWVCGSGNWESLCWAPTDNGVPNGGIPSDGDVVIVNMPDTAQPRTLYFTAASSPIGLLKSVSLWSWVPTQDLTLQFSDGVLFTNQLELQTIGYGAVTWHQSAGLVQVGSGGLTVGMGISTFTQTPVASAYELQGGTLIAPLQIFAGTDFSPAVMLHSGGVNTANAVYLGGRGAGGARYRLSGSGILNASTLVVGYELEGTFDQAGGVAQLGAMIVGGPTQFGYHCGGIATLAAGVMQAGTVTVGDACNGRFEMSGGQATVSGTLLLGRAAGIDGHFTLSGGTLHTSSTQVALQGSGSFLQTGGEHVVDHGLLLAAFPGSQGSYELVGGRLSVGGDLLGGGGTSKLVLGGGELKVTGLLSVAQFEVQANSAVDAQVIVAAGQSLSVTSGVTAMFSGAVELQSGALLSGSGTKVFDGGLSLGTGELVQLQDPGSVRLGSHNRTTVEIAGPGGRHDHLALRGDFSVGGELVVNLLGYAPQAGERFDVFDWGSLEGSFSRVRLDGAVLAPGLAWDLSQLYSTGQLAVVAVPEAPAWALLLVGLAGLVRRSRRQPVAQTAGSRTRMKPTGAVPMHWRPLAFAAALALACSGAAASPQGLSGPATSRWTVTDLGTLGGSFSTGLAINNAGQVVGQAYTSDDTDANAFVYSNGRMLDLGVLGQGYAINDAGQVTGLTYSYFFGPLAFQYGNGALKLLGTRDGSPTSSSGQSINRAGTIAGWSGSVSGKVHAITYANGTWSDLGTLGGSTSAAYGINDAGQVTGVSALSGDSRSSAFLYSNGRMVDLGSLGGSFSQGSAINNAGQVTGYSFLANDNDFHAFLYSNGNMVDLGTLGGNSWGSAINAAGQVTGNSFALDGSLHPFLYAKGRLNDLNSANGIAGSGLALYDANGLNDVGQITGTLANGHAYIATLDTIVWEGEGSGSWDSGNGWSYGVKPNLNSAVFIDPMRSLTVTGPAGAVTLKSLDIGGSPSGNNGIATLDMAGGVITVLGNAGSFTTVSAKGVLSGDGVITGAVVNLGKVNSTNLTLSDGLNNQALVTGNGRLNTSLSNARTGTVQVGPGQDFLLSGLSHTNDGLIQVTGGGSLTVAGSLNNNATGQIYVKAGSLWLQSKASNGAGGRLQLDNAQVRFDQGLSNGGQIQITTGGASVFGAVSNLSGGQILMSGNSNSTFYDPVDIGSGSVLSVSAGSAATFFGLVSQRTGAIVTGTGTKFFEGGLAIGSSPGYGADAGSVSFGFASTYFADIGGITACTNACASNEAQRNSSYDKYSVAGHLSFDGTLKLASWQGFTAQAGQSFDLFDWGSASGSFLSLDTSGLLLAAGTRLDTSRLYSDGTISVLAVPEPEVSVLLLVGLGALGWARRRRCRASRTSRWSA